MKKVILTMLLGTLGFALEFGTMGSHAFGMAGTGVAVKKSAWGLYYNPALIVADSGFKMGLYAQLQTKSNNFWEIIDYDYKALGNPDRVDDSKINSFQKLLNDNHILVGTQDGAVIQLPNFGIGSFAVGGFFNLTTQGRAKASLPTNTKQFQSSDLKVKTNFSALTLIEIPVGYAYEFKVEGEEISVGLALKYMNLSGMYGDFALDGQTDFGSSVTNLLKVDFNKSASNVGVDVGIVYEPVSFITLGVVGKNLNAPTFDLGFQKIKINPQARAGLAFNVGFWTLALDADLTSNKFLGSEIKNQMISVGTALDFKFFSLRGGVATDLQNKDDLLFALGLGIAFFDIGIQFGTKTSPLDGIKIPNYLALQLGMGFSF